MAVPLTAGVIAWNPPSGLADLCRDLIAQGCHVVVLDNGSTSGLAVLDACRGAGAQVVALGGNLGVSGALAELFTLAATEEWVLLLDQDSCLTDGFVAALTGSGATRDPAVAIVGPIVREETSGTVVQGDPGRTEWYAVRGVITSGSLCRVAAVREAGGVRQDLFIDYVDWDLCLRVQARGRRVAVEPTAALRHSIGSTTEHEVAGVTVRASHHGPDRQYYKYRNFLLLTRAGTWHGHARWALRHGAALAWGPFKIVILETGRRPKLRAIADGVKDGLRGRGGPRPTRGVGARSRG